MHVAAAFMSCPMPEADRQSMLCNGCQSCVSAIWHRTKQIYTIWVKASCPAMLCESRKPVAFGKVCEFSPSLNLHCWGFIFLIHIHFKFKIFSVSEGQPSLSINMLDMQYRAIIVLCPLFQVSYIALKIAEKERKEKIDGALYRFGWVEQEEVNILPLQDRAQF